MKNARKHSSLLVAILITALTVETIGHALATASVANASRSTYNIPAGGKVTFAVAATNVPVQVMMGGLGANLQGVAGMDTFYGIGDTNVWITVTGIDWTGTLIHEAIERDELINQQFIPLQGHVCRAPVSIGVTSSDPAGAHLPDRIYLSNGAMFGSQAVVVTQIW